MTIKGERILPTQLSPRKDLELRFGTEAAERIAALLGEPKLGDPTRTPAPPERARGSFIGAVVGEVLGAPVEEWQREAIAAHYGKIHQHVSAEPTAGADTQLALLTADSVLADSLGHPERFAARLAGTSVDTAGRAVPEAQAAIRAGEPWWNAGSRHSAGTSGAARCIAFGLIWAGNPRRAAYEAALSTAVTHGHPAATSAAAAFAAAVALAAESDGPLGPQWLKQVANVCSDFRQGSTGSGTVVDRLHLLPAMLGHSPEAALGMIGTGALAMEAVPAALWCAATASVPIEGLIRAVNAGGDTDTIALMAGACLGARFGESVWAENFTAVDGLDAAIDVADRIAQCAGGATSHASTSNDDQDAAAGDDDIPVNVSVLLDRSGSMKPLVHDVVGGFNTFLDNQKRESGDCTLTVVQFDSGDPFEVIYDSVPVSEVPELTSDRYQPRSMTPLLDAVGDLIDSVDQRIASHGKAEDQIVVVVTDGLENASTRWTRRRLFAKVARRRESGWTFVFMGANQDSYLEAGGIGIDRANTQNFRGDSRGVRTAMGSLDRAVRDYRRDSWRGKQMRKPNLFQDLKEAEADHLSR